MMSEPRGSRILGAALLVVIIAVVVFGFWAVVSMAFVEDAAPTPVLFAIGSILLGAVAIATALWLIRSVGGRHEGSHPTSPPVVDTEPPA